MSATPAPDTDPGARPRCSRPANAATGDVIGKCDKRHRAVAFRRFLAEIYASVPGDLDIHIVMDNYATHKTPAIRAWFARRPRWHVHFTPTGASRLNIIERFFAEITERQIKRGVHRSERERTPSVIGQRRLSESAAA